MAGKGRSGGRPVKGRDQAGNPVASSKSYPQLTVRVPPALKVNIDLLAIVQRTTQAGVIEAAVAALIERLPLATRRALDGLRSVHEDSDRG